MRRIVVDIINYLDKLPNYEELMPQEFAVSTSWIQEGVVEHRFIKENKTGSILVFKNVDEAEVRRMISSLPMYFNFDKIEYSIVNDEFEGIFLSK